jgi:hypothetical protein
MSIHIEKEFKCSCGRVFQNSQSFNGHKSHCKAHHLAKYGNTDKWELNKKLTIEHAKKANKQRKVNMSAEKASKEALWITEQHICERCSKVMAEKFGSGRFCSRACANSRERSDETKNKIRKTLQNTLLPQAARQLHNNKQHGVVFSRNTTPCCYNCEYFPFLYRPEMTIKKKI